MTLPRATTGRRYPTHRAGLALMARPFYQQWLSVRRVDEA